MIFAHGVNIDKDMTYTNGFGECKVLDIDEKTKNMIVVYINGEKMGQKQTLEMAGQAKIIHNQRVRINQEMKMKEINLASANSSFTLGFLAQHAFVFVRVKESNQIWFETTYKRLTGITACKPNIEGNYYTVSSDTLKGSGDYFHIGFPTPPDPIKGLLSFGREETMHWEVFSNVSKYNSMNYVLNLFKLGFRIGKGHEIDMVRNALEHQDDFDKGFFFDLKQAA